MKKATVSKYNLFCSSMKNRTMKKKKGRWALFSPEPIGLEVSTLYVYMKFLKFQHFFQ